MEIYYVDDVSIFMFACVGRRMMMYMLPRLIYTPQQLKTAATRPLPIERALKSNILSILAAYQLYDFFTNRQRPTVCIMNGLSRESDSGVIETI